MGSVTFLVQAKVIPKLVGIGRGTSCRMVGHIRGPLLPSKTVVPGAASGGTVYTCATGGEGLASNKAGVD